MPAYLTKLLSRTLLIVPCAALLVGQEGALPHRFEVPPQQGIPSPEGKPGTPPKGVPQKQEAPTPEAAKVCSIPLISVPLGPDAHYAVKVLPVQPPHIIDRMPQLRMPAPPCKDW